MKEFFDWFKTRQATSLFALASFGFGFIFLKNNFTGNVVLNGGGSYNLISFIGMLLILCSVALGAYSLKKRNL